MQLSQITYKHLDSLVFRSISTNPTNNNTQTTRTISFKVRDVTAEGIAQQFSTPVTRTITIVETRTAPILNDIRTIKQLQH